MNTSEVFGASADVAAAYATIANALFAGLSMLLLLVGVPFAMYNLLLIRKQHHLTSIMRFYDDMDATATNRKYIFQRFSRRDDYSDLEPEAERTAQEVINFLNRVAQLIEIDMMSGHAVLSATHTVILRCWHQLEPYARYHEGRIGGRYARRIDRLVRMARLFHDVRPHQRITSVMLDTGQGDPELVYRTNVHLGWRGRAQRIGWYIRKSLKWY